MPLAVSVCGSAWSSPPSLVLVKLQPDPPPPTCCSLSFHHGCSAASREHDVLIPSFSCSPSFPRPLCGGGEFKAMKQSRRKVIYNSQIREEGEGGVRDQVPGLLSLLVWGTDHFHKEQLQVSLIYQVILLNLGCGHNLLHNLLHPSFLQVRNCWFWDKVWLVDC